MIQFTFDISSMTDVSKQEKVYFVQIWKESWLLKIEMLLQIYFHPILKSLLLNQKRFSETFHTGLRCQHREWSSLHEKINGLEIRLLFLFHNRHFKSCSVVISFIEKSAWDFRTKLTGNKVLFSQLTFWKLHFFRIRIIYKIFSSKHCSILQKFNKITN